MSSRSRRARNQNQPLIYTSEGFTRLATEAASLADTALYTAEAELAAQLERLGDPVNDALEVIGPEEFTELVWRMPNPGRTNFLRDLKVPAARKPAPATATMGLHRIRNLSPEQRMKGVHYFSTSALRGLSVALQRWLEDRDDEALKTALVEDQSQINAVRLMVVTHWYDAPELVAALRCGLGSGLALPTWPTDIVTDVAAGCVALEAVWLEHDEHEHADGSSVESVVPHAGAAAANLDTQHQESDVVAEVVVSFDDLTAAAMQLEHAVAAARTQAEKFARHLENKRLPASRHLEPIHELYALVKRVKPLLRGANAQLGLDTAAAEFADTEDCGILLEMLGAAIAAASDERSTRDQLGRLGTITGPESSRDVLGKISELTQALVRAHSWDEAQRNYVSALTALLRLIDAASAGDSSTAMECYSIAHQHLPAELTPIVAVALLGQLTVPPRSPGEDRMPRPKAPGTAVAEGFPMPNGHSQLAGTRQTPLRPEHPEPVTEEPVATAHSTILGDEVRPAPASVAEPDAQSPELAGQGKVAEQTAARDKPIDSSQDTIPNGRTSGDATAEPGNDGEDHCNNQQIASLLRNGEYGLAHHAAAVARLDTIALALRLLTLSEAVRSETGPTAIALRNAIGELRVHHFDGNRPAQLALLAATVRAALVIADPAAGEIVKDVANNLHELQAVGQLTRTIGTASAQGVLSDSDTLKALAPIAGADNDIATASAHAYRERTKPRTIRFARANQLVDSWWSPDGLIGSLLNVAANDRREEVDDVAEKLRKLLKREFLARELRSEDERLRGSGSRPLEGSARRRLLDHAMESLEVAGSWVDAVRSELGTEQGRVPVPSILAELRAAVRQEFGAAESELKTVADTKLDVVMAASAHACLSSLTRSAQLLDGRSLSGTEPDPIVVVNRDLLRCPSLRMDGKLVPMDDITVDHISTAAITSWMDAFENRLAHEDYVAARTIVDVIADTQTETDPVRADEMSDWLEQCITRSRQELRTLRQNISSRVNKAARLGQLGPVEYAQVIAQLEAAQIERPDLGIVRGQLTGIAENLPRYAEQAKAALWARAQQELNAAAGQVADNAAETVKSCIDTGDLATAEEYLLNALAGEEPPTAETSGHRAAFLAVVSSFRTGVDADVVRAAREGTSAHGLEFGHLSDASRSAAADGLREWMEMKTIREQRHGKLKAAFASALRLAGIEFTGERPPYKLTYAPNRKWFELTGFKRMPQALMPAFGSRTDDKLKIMMCWDVQDAQTLLTWVAQDLTTDPILIALFGTMTHDQRNLLAKACAEQPDRSIMVLDDAAIAYLATTGGGQFPTTERILLPFAATNPYHPHAIGNVPREMFFGRKHELQQVTDSFGTSLLYGGRQLGKSALLKAAARQFEAVPERAAVYLSLPVGFGSTDQVDDLWSMIAGELDQRGIVPSKGRPRDSAQFVERAVTSWLGTNPSRRLLLLLDECDMFFDADAETSFRHTTRLRDLMNATDRRFKPVFAGLHQVQRFAHLPNQPLAGAHFGDPIVIGPLSPDPAYRLMFTPMETLGITFESDELVHRVLAYCNYQPKLLQLVGEALVRESLSRRGIDGPDYLIRDEDLERVIGSDTVRQKVRETVQLTLELDSRYKLIALIVALDALDNGADHTIDTNTLRDECRAWWPDGFPHRGPDEFRSLLSEMSGLGVLSERNGRWRLRSSNVLRLLGTRETIEDELCRENWKEKVTRLSAEHVRRTLKDGSISPLTERQLATVIERANRLLVVVGTPASGINRVQMLLEEEADRIGARFTIHKALRPGTFKKELTGGTEGSRHRVVVSELSNTRLDNAITSLQNALDLMPVAGVTRSVVVLADASRSDLLTCLDAPNLTSFTDQIIVMRRLSADGLRSWAASENEKISRFSDTDQKLLMDATGGWPTLLDEAAQLAASRHSARRVCELVTAGVASGKYAIKLVEEVGITNNPAVNAAFAKMIEYDGPMTMEDLVELFDEYDCHGIRLADLLRYLDVIEERPEDGRWVLEPVFAAAWKAARSNKPATAE
ncbi:hypothetical protein [Kutzneria buriramensis]|uniref:AAA domain-containing protein n=1 Tax=Kutzneria buriramensis TaxID=1045776 RepID=A0A3E0GXU1_9PSEU|nr:hypothetical protein [Kutzneria buriramensis]REH30664.1 hypothetical protein BCF44_12322 [Kutzneria buriramensis]